MYAIIGLPGDITDEQCCLELLEQHSSFIPGFSTILPKTIVISLICPEKEFRQGLAILPGYLDYRNPK
ncbi:MAG: hypothetical protein VR65_17745 [Desulfobulbaceae bacterium BRH_c16a]|nr:MAG: hypothetical protein VR65_17745 [Desulfobulbaceae bacterium BRH_c16a]